MDTSHIFFFLNREIKLSCWKLVRVASRLLLTGRITMTLLTLANFLWRRFHLRQQTMATMPTTRRRVEQTTDTMVMIIVILFRGKGTCCITLADSGTGSEKMQTLNACSSDDHWNGSLAYKWDFFLLFMCTMYFIPNNTSITISTPKFRIKPIIPVNKRLLNRSCKSTITNT